MFIVPFNPPSRPVRPEPWRPDRLPPIPPRRDRGVEREIEDLRRQVEELRRPNPPIVRPQPQADVSPVTGNTITPILQGILNSLLQLAATSENQATRLEEFNLRVHGVPASGHESSATATAPKSTVDELHAVVERLKASQDRIEQELLALHSLA